MKNPFYFLMLIAAVSCTPLLNVTTTQNAKQLWQQHKRVAIIPLLVTSGGFKNLKKENIELEKRNMKKLSFSIQNNMYKVLLNQYNLSNLSVTLMPVDSVTQLLAQSGIVFSNLPSKNLNQLCSILRVDAVVAGEVEFFNPANILSGSNSYETPAIEKALVSLHIYDKNQEKPIWTFREEDKAKEYSDYYKRSGVTTVSNAEYLVAYMFDKAMKILPYVIKSPIKRTY